jgi:hypothetical protein
MVRAGLVGADDRKKEASTTNRFSWSKERKKELLQGRFAGIAAEVLFRTDERR